MGRRRDLHSIFLSEERRDETFNQVSRENRVCMHGRLDRKLSSPTTLRLKHSSKTFPYDSRVAWGRHLRSRPRNSSTLNPLERIRLRNVPFATSRCLAQTKLRYDHPLPNHVTAPLSHHLPSGFGQNANDITSADDRKLLH